MSLISVVRWDGELCHLLDQTQLPFQETFLPCRDYREVVGAIQRLAVRGAPAIGVAAAFGAALAAKEALSLGADFRRDFLRSALRHLAEARPTAVNLRWAIQRVEAAWARAGEDCSERVLPLFIGEAKLIEASEIASNERIAAHGAEILPAGDIITHCNAGTLATIGIGTALGVIREAFRRGKVGRVYPCETRPLLQGLRLTTWELARDGIPFTAICDSMAAWLMHEKKPSAVVTGADRIVGNGDVANKIGTYALALAARHHGIPFFIAAPVSTFDLGLASGSEIPIEERHGDEIFGILGGKKAPYPVSAWNPAFDVTPAELITAIICEGGVARAPYRDTLRDVIGRA